MQLSLSFQIHFLLIFTHQSLTQSPPISPNSMKWQNVGECSTNLDNSHNNNSREFFNAISMRCEQCPKEMESDGRGMNECKCANGRIWRGKVGGEGGRCEKCEKDLAVSTDGFHCVKCLASDGTILGTDPSSGKCPKCANRNEIAQLEWTNSNNSQFVEKCIICPAGTIPNWDENRCERCQRTECICEKDNSSSNCAPLSPNAYSISLFDNGDLPSFSSHYLERNMQMSELKCREGSRRQCEHLANLCVLQDYAKQPGGACTALENAKNTATQIPIVPQLFYTNIEASVEIFRDNAIDTVFELFPPKNHLDFVLMIFSLNGTLLGQQSVRLGLLQICRSPNSDPSTSFQFGNFIRQKCQLCLSDLYDWKELLTKSREVEEETLFFELYIRYEDTNGEIMLYPIPILNGDIRGDQYTGIFPNRLSELRRDSRVLLSKRFYIFDIQRQSNNGGQTNTTNLLIRTANRIAFNFHLQPFREGRIFIPYLQISHTQTVQQTLDITTLVGESPKFDFEFRILYHVDSYAYDKTIEVVMATVCSVTAVWAALRAYSWGRRSGKLIIDASTILKFVLYGAEGISNVFLFVISITAVWLIYAFKMQSHMFYVPLNEHQEGSFVAYLISATALKALSLTHSLISLILVQTFFIDWERPKTKTPTKAVKAENMQNNENENGQNSVVIWRTYLIANEWNELQMYRKTQLSLQLFLVLFLLEYLEFGNYAKIQSGFGRVDQSPEIVETRMSRFAVDISFYFSLTIAQWLIQVIVVERVTDPFRNFMDLCSVANISIMAMTNPLMGLYIHGRSVHGYADTDMLQMNAFLQRERDNLCALRGLEMGSDLQTFVVNFPRAFRDRIDQISETVRKQPGENAKDKTTQRIQQKGRIYCEMNEFFKDFVNRVDPQCEYVITDSRLIEELLDLELIDTTKVGTFRRDPSETKYSSAFLYGNEWVLMSFEMLFFCLMDLFWQNRVLAAFATYLVSKCIVRLTKVYFTQQLANSSMVDSRFLI